MFFSFRIFLRAVSALGESSNSNVVLVTPQVAVEDIRLSYPAPDQDDDDDKDHNPRDQHKKESHDVIRGQSGCTGHGFSIVFWIFFGFRDFKVSMYIYLAYI